MFGSECPSTKLPGPSNESVGRYNIGNSIGWALGHATGEAYFIGNFAADLERHVLVLATPSQVGIEIEARDCRIIGPGNPIIGNEYRQRYARQRPGRLLELQVWSGNI